MYLKCNRIVNAKAVSSNAKNHSSQSHSSNKSKRRRGGVAKCKWSDYGLDELDKWMDMWYYNIFKFTLLEILWVWVEVEQ